MATEKQRRWRAIFAQRYGKGKGKAKSSNRKSRGGSMARRGKRRSSGGRGFLSGKGKIGAIIGMGAIGSVLGGLLGAKIANMVAPNNQIANYAGAFVGGGPIGFAANFVAPNLLDGLLGGATSSTQNNNGGF